MCMEFLWVIWGELLKRCAIKKKEGDVVSYVTAHSYITGCVG